MRFTAKRNQREGRYLTALQLLRLGFFFLLQPSTSSEGRYKFFFWGLFHSSTLNHVLGSLASLVHDSLQKVLSSPEGSKALASALMRVLSEGTELPRGCSLGYRLSFS